MRALLLILATVDLSFAASAIAQPVNAPRPSADHVREVPAPIALTATNDARTPAPTEQKVPAAAKRERKGRVMTCRCGDLAANN